MIRAQGGDPDAALPTAAHTHTVTADVDGYLAELDALAVGVASWRLGAGRARRQDPVQFGAGIELHAVKGEKVTAGQPLFTLHADDERRFERSLEVLRDGFTISAEAPVRRESVVLERVTAR